MQITTEKREVIAQGMKAERQFTVKVGAHIMQVLSGLYAKPIDAMVREYLTNMHDANLALKKANPTAEILPAELTVPSSLSSELIFKDFGIGMDYETVWNVYAQYGNSTKSDSNDEVGGFGLGSKTAFCYNNGAAWTIESRKDGQKHIFMAFVGEDGVPNLTHVSTKPCNEHSGVTIKIPIRREDIGQVTTAVQKYAPYFPSPLTIGGMIAPKPREYKIRSESNAWGIGSLDGVRMHDGVTVVMGNVPYTVHSDSLSAICSKLKRGDNQYHLNSFLSNVGLNLIVPIGSVDIVPSRDNLKYTDRTIATIQNGIKTMLDEIPELVVKEMAACTTEWDALCKCKDLLNLYGIQNVIAMNKFHYNGKQLLLDVGIERQFKDLRKLDPTVEMTMIGVREEGKSRISPLTDGVDKKGEPILSEKLRLRPDGRTFLVVDNIGKGALLATKAMLYRDLVNKTSSGRAASWGHKVGHAILLTTKLSNKDLSKFFGGYPTDKILMANDLKGIAVPAAIKTDNRETVYRWNDSSWDARINIPDKAPKYYYLPLQQDPYSHRWVYSNKDGTRNLVAWADAMKVLPAGSVLYGMKSTDEQKFIDMGWINLFDAVKERALDAVKKSPERWLLRSIPLNPSRKSDYLRQVISSIQASTMHDVDIDSYMTTIKKIQDSISDSLLSLAQKFLSRYATECDPELKKILTPHIKLVNVDLLKMENAIFAKYPFLRTLTDMRHFASSRYEYNGDPFRDHQKLLLDILSKTC